MRKKILHLITTFSIGGAEMHLLSLVKGLLETGRYDITVAFFKEEAQEARSLVPDFRSLGVEVVDLKMRSRFDIFALIRLYRLMKKNNFQILHTHLFRADLFGLPIGKIAGIPICISSIHNTEGFFSKAYVSFLLRQSYKFAHKIIAISLAVKDKVIRSIGVPKEKVVVVHYGLDCNAVEESLKSKTDVRNLLGIEQDCPLIGTVGRLTIQKGHLYLIEAFSLVKKEFSKVKLLIAGHDDGGLKESLKRLIKEKGLEGEVFLPGYMDGKSVIKSLDIFVLPSLWEGFGLVLLEAMYAEKPIIASRVDAIPEILIDGETGILVPPKDILALRDAIKKMIKNSELCKGMGFKGKKRAIEEFSISKMIAKTVEIYEHLLFKD